MKTIVYQDGEGGFDEHAYIQKQNGKWEIVSRGVELEDDPMLKKIIACLNGDATELLGKKPKQQELADYLGVNKATVSGYPKKKKELMLLGLWVKKAFKNAE